tara:strand:- start:314 stop:745 length:432 start_codon:yes stop_codon:yes gene_type:complete
MKNKLYLIFFLLLFGCENLEPLFPVIRPELQTENRIIESDVCQISATIRINEKQYLNFSNQTYVIEDRCQYIEFIPSYHNKINFHVNGMEIGTPEHCNMNYLVMMLEVGQYAKLDKQVGLLFLDGYIQGEFKAEYCLFYLDDL